MEDEDDTQTTNIDTKNAAGENSGFDPGPFTGEFSIHSENFVEQFRDNENDLSTVIHSDFEAVEYPAQEEDLNSVI